MTLRFKEMDIFSIIAFISCTSVCLGLKTPNDPQWLEGNMWYWGEGSAMKLWEAWSSGATGKGQVIVVLDDGMDLDSEEINYDSSLEYDLVEGRRPHSTFGNVHGAKVATVAAGKWGNGKCGFGAAPEATVSAARVISLTLKPVPLIKALLDSNRLDKTSVFLAAWGGKDDGESHFDVITNIRRAQKIVAEQGRSGKGAFFVTPSGNGGEKGDDCGADEVPQGPYVIAVQATNRDGKAPKWTEPCSASFTSVYVDTGLVATFPKFISSGEQCTNSFNGTSAAVPVVGGILALAMHKNPDLSRADLMHLLVNASDPRPLDQIGWHTNAAGIKFHYRFGFGLLNAEKLVVSAANASPTLSPKVHSCTIKKSGNNRFVVSSDNCSASTVEFVSLTFDSSAADRSVVEVILSSPSGTNVTLLGRRANDQNDKFENWFMSSPFFWNEPATGNWTLIFLENSVQSPTLVLSAELQIYWSEKPPVEPTTPSPTTDSGLGAGEKVGIGFGVLVGIVAVIVGVVACARNRVACFRNVV